MKACIKGIYCLLVLDGYESYCLLEFDDYCKVNNIIMFYIFFYSLYFLQPLDVGCFGLLKLLYGKEIEKMMRMQIIYIMKDDFFAVYLVVYKAFMTEKNIKLGFKVVRLILFNL